MPDGMPVGPKTTFAGSDASTISMPIDLSSALMMASCVVRVAFDAVQHAVAPGQAVVMYDGDVVVGGGWID